MKHKTKKAESAPHPRKVRAWPKSSNQVPTGLKDIVNRVSKKGIVTLEVCPLAELKIAKRFPMHRLAPEFTTAILRLAWTWPKLLEAEHDEGALRFVVNGGVAQFCHPDHTIPPTGSSVGSLLLDKMRSCLEFEADADGVRPINSECHLRRADDGPEESSRLPVFLFALFEFYRYCKSIIAPIYKSLPQEKWELIARGLTQNEASKTDTSNVKRAANRLKKQLCASIDRIGDSVQLRHKYVRNAVIRKVAPPDWSGSVEDVLILAETNNCSEEVVRLERAVLDAVVMLVATENKLPTKMQVRELMNELGWQWIYVNLVPHESHSPQVARGLGRSTTRSPGNSSPGPSFVDKKLDTHWTHIWSATGLSDLPTTKSKSLKTSIRSSSAKKRDVTSAQDQGNEHWIKISKEELEEMTVAEIRRRKEHSPTIDELRQLLRFIPCENRCAGQG